VYKKISVFIFPPTSVGVGYKLILESQRIEVESEISEGEVPTNNLFDN